MLDLFTFYVCIGVIFYAIYAPVTYCLFYDYKCLASMTTGIGFAGMCIFLYPVVICLEVRVAVERKWVIKDIIDE